MAWAEKLPSNRYRGVYRDSTGRRRSAGTYPHKAAAVRAAAAAEAEDRTSRRPNPDAWRTPWGEWADTWWPTRNVEPGTAKVDAGRRRLHLDPRWATTPLGEITRHDVKAWAAQLRGDNLSAETIRRIVHLLSSSLAAAVDAEILTNNPAARLRLPTGPKNTERYLTPDEYAAIRTQLPTGRDRLIADLLISLGLRWGELAGLHWQRVFLDRGQLLVADTFHERAGDIAPYPKGKANRWVPIPTQLSTALTSELERLDQGGLATHPCKTRHRVGACRTPLVVGTERGHAPRNSNWAATWRAAVAASGVGHARIHDLRHTYASWLLQDGVPLATVGQLLGHQSSVTTERYAHLAEPPAAAVVAALEARWRSWRAG